MTYVLHCCQSFCAKTSARTARNLRKLYSTLPVVPGTVRWSTFSRGSQVPGIPVLNTTFLNEVMNRVSEYYSIDMCSSPRKLEPSILKQVYRSDKFSKSVRLYKDCLPKLQLISSIMAACDALSATISSDSERVAAFLSWRPTLVVRLLPCSELHHKTPEVPNQSPSFCNDTSNPST